MEWSLEARALTKHFGQALVLRGAALTIKGGEIHALCGENGAGKSTLVKILTGVHQPDGGTVAIAGIDTPIRDPRAAQALGIGYVSQELSVPPHLSVFDNVWLGCRDVPFLRRSDTMRARAREALSAVGLGHLALERAAGSLSIGEMQLLEIARMLVRDIRLLILDEPTATLSDPEIDRVFAALRRLKANGTSVIFITHRLGEVAAVCDRVTVMRNGETVWTSPVDEVGRDRLIELMLGRPVGEMYPESDHAAGGDDLVVTGLTVPARVRDLSFSAPRGQITSIVGQIGSGAAETIRALAGLVYQATGRVVLNGRPLRLGSVAAMQAENVRFVSEDRAAEGVFLRLPVRDNLGAMQLGRVSAFGYVAPGKVGELAGRLAAAVGVDARRLDSTLGELSGGNQQKVAIGRAIVSGKPGVLLMNEPTRGVDVGARAEIYATIRRLCEDGTSVVMMTTDLEEAIGLSDKIVTLYRGEKVAEYRRGAITLAGILADITHPDEGGAAA